MPEGTSLRGKIAVVTGAAQGLGAAILERLAREGCDAIGWDLNAEALDATVKAVADKTERQIKGVTVDVTDAESVRSAMDAAVG